NLGYKLHATKSSEPTLPVVIKWRGAPPGRRRVVEGGGGVAVDEGGIEEGGGIGGRGQRKIEGEEVRACDSMALAHLRNLERKFRNPRQLARGGLDPDDRHQLVAEGTRIDLGSVAGDHAGALEALNALGDRRRGEVDAPAELGERDPAVG